MARPLRYEAAGVTYHVMARGAGGKGVFEGEVDRAVWLTLSQVRESKELTRRLGNLERDFAKG